MEKANTDRIKLFNIEIDNCTMKELVERFDEGVLFTPNVDHIIKLQKDPEFLACYKQADWLVCDSTILRLTAKLFLNIYIKEVIPGSSFLPAFYNYHKNNRDIKMFLLGAAEGVAETAAANINRKVGWDMVIGCYSPPFGFEKDSLETNRIIEKINKSEANVLIVGLGAPKQEKWIFKNKDYLPDIRQIMALGATIDFEAGNVRRAPAFFQKLHLEWFYRLVKEPKRLWKRYLIDDMYYFKILLKELLRN